MNLDDADEILQDNESREVWNSIANVPGSMGKIKKLKGFENVLALSINSDIVFPGGATFTCVGSGYHMKSGSIVYMLCDTAKITNVHPQKAHSILRMFTENKRCEWVLKNVPKLNFQVNFRIKKLNFIEDLMKWTDNYEGTPFVDYNPPRCLNIVMATAMTNFGVSGKMIYKGMILGYTYGVNNPHKSYRYIANTPNHDNVQPPLLAGTLTLNSNYWEVASNYVYGGITTQILDEIKYPPIYAPIVSFNADQSQKVNKLRNKMFQFSYRYTYVDKEKSVWSDVSNIPLPSKPEQMNGSFDETIMMDNVIDIKVDIGTAEVELVEIAMRELNEGIWKIITQIYKYNEDGTLNVFNATGNYIYHFYNNEVGIPISQDEAYILYDAVPQIAGNQTMVEKTRMLYADYVEGFNNINIDLRLKAKTTVPTLVQGGSQIGIFDTFSTKNVFFAFSSVHWGMPFYHVAVLDFQSFFATGYTYLVSVSVVTYKYDPPIIAGDQYPDYPIENQGDTITAIASVYADPAKDTIDTVLDRICYQLRQGNGSDKSALAITWPGGTSYPCPYRPYAHWFTLNGNSQDGIQQPGVMTSKYWLGIVINSYYDPYDAQQVTISVTKSTSFYKIPTFPSGTNQPFGQIYYDRTGSRCGAVQTNINANVYIPSQTAGITTNNERTLVQNYIECEIHHQPSIEAEYWSLAYPKNTSENYSLWTVLYDIGIASGIGTNDKQLYFTINKPINDTANYNKKFNIEPYQWAEGDRVRFLFWENKLKVWLTIPAELDFEIVGQQTPGDDTAYLRDDNINLSATPPKTQGDFILDADGNKMPDNTQYKFIIQDFNYAYYNIVAKQTIVQIYRPRPKEEMLTWFQYGPKHKVINPHTDKRYHEGGNGTDIISVLYQQNQNATQPAKLVLFNGDAYLNYRMLVGVDIFPVESAWYSDWYNSEAISIGKPNIQLRDMQRKRYISNILYGGRYISNTNTNDLSKVDSGNTITLADKYGAINWMEEVGFVLKVLQEKKPTSIPISRITYSDVSGGEGAVGASKSVLDEPQPHESDYGTTHGTGVVKYETRYWFPDINAGLILMDSNNGIHPISLEYNIDSFIKARFKAFLEDGLDNIQVYAAYDEFYKMVYFSFEDSQTPALNFTVVLKEGVQEIEGFISFQQFVPDFYGQAKLTLTSFASNSLWLHNSDNVPPMNFYGTQYTQQIKLVFNKPPVIVKDHRAIQVNATEEYFCKDAGDVRIPADGTYREKQTKIPKGRFKKKEGKYYTEIPRNMLTHQLTPKDTDAVNGDVMRGKVIEFNLTNDTTKDTEMFDVQVDSTPSLGG
jgi:hypothetical protein